MPTHRPASRVAPTASQSASDSWSMSTSTPATPAKRSSSMGGSAAQQCTATGVGASRSRVWIMAPLTSLGSTDRCREKPLAVAIVPASTAGSSGSSSWIDELNIRQPPAELGNELSDSLSKRLVEIAPRPVVGEQTITARTLHHGRHRPGARDRKLDRSLVSLGVLFEQIEVSAKCADRQPMIPAGCVGEPPSSRLQVDGQPGEEGSRASDHLGVRSARRKLRHVREIRALRKGDLDRIHHVGTRPGTNARGPDRRQVAVRGGGDHARVAEMVALPTTREPAYRTTA